MSSAAAAAFVPFLVDAVGDVEVTTVNAACGGGDRATSSSFITSVGASDLNLVGGEFIVVDKGQMFLFIYK